MREDVKQEKKKLLTVLDESVAMVQGMVKELLLRGKNGSDGSGRVPEIGSDARAGRHQNKILAAIARAGRHQNIVLAAMGTVSERVGIMRHSNATPCERAVSQCVASASSRHCCKHSERL